MTPYLQTAGWALIHFVWQGAAIAGAASVLLRLTRRRIGERPIRDRVREPRRHARGAGRDRAADVDCGADRRRRPNVDASRQRSGRRLSTRDARRDLADTGCPSGRLVRSTDAVDRVARASPSVRSNAVLPAVTVAWLVGVALAARAHGRRLVARPAAASHRARDRFVAVADRAAAGWRIASGSPRPRTSSSPRSSTCRRSSAGCVRRSCCRSPRSASLTPAQVEAILAHELAHIRRHDYAVNVLQTLAETLLFYHPAVWWVSKRIRVEREHCCDDIAVAICGDPIGYAQALAELETWRTSIDDDGAGGDRRVAARSRAADPARADRRRAALAELGRHARADDDLHRRRRRRAAPAVEQRAGRRARRRVPASSRSHCAARRRSREAQSRREAPVRAAESPRRVRRTDPRARRAARRSRRRALSA